ncbi:hypothetical protein IAR50_002286 [Cryptococcus sp. DSM 104548]
MSSRVPSADRSPGPIDDKSEEGDLVAHFIRRVLSEKPSYIGIYGPGDYFLQTYRIVLPYSPRGPGGQKSKTRKGRGYKGCREEVVLETDKRDDLNALLDLISGLVRDAEGPIATRHIVNPSQAKDEGVRLIWAEDGEKGEEEMRDWPRRDRMRREGKTVKGADDVMAVDGEWGQDHSSRVEMKESGLGMSVQWQTLEATSRANRIFWADKLVFKSTPDVSS